MKQDPMRDIINYTKITDEICKKKIKVYNIIEEIIMCRKRLNDY